MVTVPPERRSRPVVHHLAAQAPEQLGHDRDVEDVRDVGDRGAAPGEQGGGHELQDAVLGAHDADLALEALTARDPEHLLHGGHRRADCGPEAGGIGCPYGQSHPHLHPHRRRRHHLPGRHEPHHQERPAPHRVCRRGRGQLRDRRGDRGKRSLRRRAGRAPAHPERAVRRGRRPVHPGGRPSPSTHRCGWRPTTSSGSSPRSTPTTPSCRRCARSCCPGGRPRRRTCTWHAPWSAAPSGPPGRRWPSTATR